MGGLEDNSDTQLSCPTEQSSNVFDNGTFGNQGKTSETGRP
jgi:hypothetical protein